MITLTIKDCSGCPYHAQTWQGYWCHKGRSKKPNPNLGKIIGKNPEIPEWCPIVRKGGL